MKIPDLSSSILHPVALALILALLAGPATATPQETPAEPAESDPAGFFTERVDVRVINVDVVVTDRSARSIGGLTRENFELRVDGEPFPITNFYSETGGAVDRIIGTTTRPAEPDDPSFRTVEEAEVGVSRRTHVVVLVDHTRLSANNRKRTFKSVREAIDGLDPEDLVALVGVEGSLVFYSDFLYDRAAVDRILDDLELVAVQSNINEMERRQIFGELARGMSGGIQAGASQAEAQPIMSRIRAYAAQEYARSIQSMQQIETVVSTLNGVPGRKALLYVAEGIPTRPGEGLFVEWRNRFGGGNPQAGIGLRRFDYNIDYEREVGRFDLNQPMIQLSKAANRAEVALYAIDAEGDHGAIVRSALTEQGATSETLSVIDENFREPLEAVAKATGGRLLRSSGKLGDQLLEVVSDLQTFYSIGFAAPEGWVDGGDHNIEIKVRDGGKFTVRHREAVRLPKPDEREASATVAALMYQTANNPLALQATPGPKVRRDDGNAAIEIDLAIPIERLGFLPQGDVQAGSLTIYVATQDGKGNPGQVQKVPFHLNLPEEVMAEAMKDSARYPLPVVLRPGDQHVAIGVRDNVNGVFSAIRLDVSGLSRL